jgi:putative SOS response-associated peptidase YedK
MAHRSASRAFGRWKELVSGEWIRTFAIITTDANELVAHIHDRMPVIIAPGEYARWLGRCHAIVLLEARQRYPAVLFVAGVRDALNRTASWN